MNLEDFMTNVENAAVMTNGMHRKELHIFIKHEEFEPRNSKMTFRLLAVPVGNRRIDIFFGEDGIFCTGYYWMRDNQTGFGGAEIEVQPLGKIKGPWSSRPSVYMKYGAPHYDEVVIHRNHAQLVGMKIEAIKHIMEKYCPDYELVGANNADEEFQYKIVKRSDSNVETPQNLDLRFPMR